MTYSSLRSSLARATSRLAVLRLDTCAHIFGQTPCAATDTPCYYTYSTCKDPNAFTRASRELIFGPADGPPVAGALPFLADMKEIPTEIRPEDGLTRRARMTIRFIDDHPLRLANPEKSVGNAENAGTFFRNLIARHPNLVGKEVAVKSGFEGLPASDFQTVFQGVIDKVEWKEGSFTLVVKDRLKLLDIKIPGRASSDNALTAAYDGGAVMYVGKGAEFAEKGAVKIDDEYVTYTAKNLDTLTGCVPGAFGTAPASHPAGKRVSQVEVFADPTTGDGLPPDRLFLSLLVTHGGLDPLVMATADRGVTITSAIGESDSAIPVDDDSWLPGAGVARLDDELIVFERGDSQLTAVERGAYGTAAAAHQSGARFLITRASDELGRWMAGTLYRARVEEPTPVKDLLNALLQECLCHVWQGEDADVRLKAVAPPFFTEPPSEIDDDRNIVAGSTSWDPGHDLQTTRVVVYYDPLTARPSEDPDSYASALAVVDAEVESDNLYGIARGDEIYARWIYREHEALLLASRKLIRFRHGAARFSFSLELKDEGLMVGDFVRITSRDLAGPDGAPRDRPLFEILKKCKVSDNRVDYTAMDTSLDRRYPVISPSSLTTDYDQAAEAEREIYGFIGDSANRVGTGQDDGYYIY